MLENKYITINEENDNINFDNIKIPLEPEVKKEVIIPNTQEEENIIKSYANEYISNMKEHYEAEESLFDNLSDLIEESQDQEKLLKILDSL